MGLNEAGYDCQQCGACCVFAFGEEGYVSLSRVEAKRARRRGLPVVEDSGCGFLGTRPHDGPAGDSICVAFTGAVGGACACTIYPQRPKKCRQFEAGSRACRKARRAAGLPV